MARGLLEQEQVAVGAGTVACWAGHQSSPGPFGSHRCHLGQRRGQGHRDTGSSLPPHQLMGLGHPSPPSSACPNAQLPSPAWHTSKGKGCHERAWWDTREARGFDGDVASPTAGHQPGGSPAAAGSALGSCVRGKPPAPPTDTGGRVMALPLGHRAQRCWAGLLVWPGAARRPGSPVPAGRRLAAGQCCPSAQALNPARGTVSRQPAVS